MSQQININLGKYTTDKSNKQLLYVRPARAVRVYCVEHLTTGMEVKRKTLFKTKMDRINAIMSKIDNPVISHENMSKMIKIIVEKP